MSCTCHVGTLAVMLSIGGCCRQHVCLHHAILWL